MIHVLDLLMCIGSLFISLYFTTNGIFRGSLMRSKMALLGDVGSEFSFRIDGSSNLDHLLMRGGQYFF